MPLPPKRERERERGREREREHNMIGASRINLFGKLLDHSN